MSRKGFMPIVIGIIAVLILICVTGILYYTTPPKATTLTAPTTPYVSNISVPLATPPPRQPVTMPSFSGNGAEQSGPLTAAHIEEIQATETFALSEYPQASFTIGDIYIGTGGVTNSYCGELWQNPTDHYIFIQDEPPGISPSGTCFDTTQQSGGESTRIVTFTFTTNDNGPSDVWGTFIRGAYSLTTASGTVTRIAHYVDPWGGYGATAYSSRDIVLSFAIPAGVDSMNIYYGNYPNIGDATGPANFADQGGYQIDLVNNTIQNISD